jgi:hypothetical protein
MPVLSPPLRFLSSVSSSPLSLKWPSFGDHWVGGGTRRHFFVVLVAGDEQPRGTTTSSCRVKRIAPKSKCNLFVFGSNL